MGASPTLATKSECSAVWSACLIWIQEVVGSNPTTPTTNKVLVRGDAEGSSPHNGPAQTLARQKRNYGHNLSFVGTFMPLYVNG